MEEFYIANNLVNKAVQVSMNVAGKSIKLTGKYAQNLTLLMLGVFKYSVGKVTGETKNRGRVSMNQLTKNGSTFFLTINKSEMPQFSKSLKRFGVKYHILTDLTDKNLRHYNFTSADAQKVEQIVQLINLRYSEKTEMEIESQKLQENNLEPSAKASKKSDRDLIKEFAEKSLSESNFQGATQVVAQASKQELKKEILEERDPLQEQKTLTHFPFKISHSDDPKTRKSLKSRVARLKLESKAKKQNKDELKKSIDKVLEKTELIK